MRITSEMMVANSLRRLQTRLAHYERVQSQLASGSRMLSPSDDPSGTGRALGLRANLRAREQEARNAGDAKAWLDVADSQLQATTDRLQRVRELAVRGASSLGQPERQAIAQELVAIREELVAVANTRHGGRPLFSGYGQNDAVANVAGTWVYQGDQGAVTRRVGESDVVRVNVTADEVFGFTSPDGSVFALIDDLVAGLGGPDPATALADGVGRIDAARQRIGDAQATIGANANWVASALRRSGDALLSVRTQLAEVEDVDIAEAVMELQTQEVAYSATLQALARALPPSLAAFLR